MSTTHVCTEAYSKNGISIVSSVTLKVFILRVVAPVPEPQPERRPCFRNQDAVERRCHSPHAEETAKSFFRWFFPRQAFVQWTLECLRTMGGSGSSLPRQTIVVSRCGPGSVWPLVLPHSTSAVSQGTSNKRPSAISSVETRDENIWVCYVCDECQQPLSAISKRLLSRKRDRHINEVPAGLPQGRFHNLHAVG